ncbi:MAG: endonuclease/exonuclease/phosphatase family protein [Ignavibacteriaceae bacterium]
MTKKILLKTLAAFVLIFLLTSGKMVNKGDSIIIMSYNIRVGVDEGINSWENRKEKVASMIMFHHADIIGGQEALINQFDDLSKLLPDYDWFGVGRDDGENKGEFSAVFYNKNRFHVLNSSTFWLSETPQVVSVGWDAALPRIVTWGELKDKNSGQSFFIFNTHFDHIGETARQNSAELIVNKVKEIAVDKPSFVTGDFNAKPDSKVYEILTVSLKDAQFESINGHYGSDITFNDFGRSAAPGNKIDFIFVKNDVKVLQHGVIGDTFNGNYPSDHMPVIAEVIAIGSE